MDSIWMQILAFALPGGFRGSVFTWIFSRRKQNNDFLKELQSSINLLSGENKKILEENIQLRRENIDLKANQEEMLVRIDRLTKEVERLRKTIGKRNSYEDKTLFAAIHPAAGKLHCDEEAPLDRDTEQDGYRVAHATRRTKRRRANRTSGNELSIGGDLCAAGAADGGDSASDSSGDGDGGEPP